MRNYRVFNLVSVIALAMATVTLRSAAAPEVEKVDVTPGKASQPVSLRDRLVVGLQARLKSEVSFCEVVAIRVNTGQLPQRLVDETFFWARQRAAAVRTGPNHRPIIYFQPAMRARASRINVLLP